MSVSLRESVTRYCAEIGSDALLVQGAGGNVSWKDGNTLWVKASGMWLADAAAKDLFVPVDLPYLRAAIKRHEFDITPRPIGAGPLRPSIETMFHALMPQRIVVHLHAVEILARLVREDCFAEVTQLLDDSVKWVMVDYHKPGAPLAAAIHAALAENPAASVVLMRNHGLIIGGRDVDEIHALLTRLTQTLRISLPGMMPPAPPGDPSPEQMQHYHRIADPQIQQLALRPELFAQLNAHWALYPDHVVFLGAQAHCYASETECAAAIQDAVSPPELLFIRGVGVYAAPSFNAAKRLQLHCYYEVLRRQPNATRLRVLSLPQIAELLNWDAEQYRQQVAK